MPYKEINGKLSNSLPAAEVTAVRQQYGHYKNHLRRLERKYLRHRLGRGKTVLKHHLPSMSNFTFSAFA
jgi:hypothetical protein